MTQSLVEVSPSTVICRTVYDTHVRVYDSGSLVRTMQGRCDSATTVLSPCLSPPLTELKDATEARLMMPVQTSGATCACVCVCETRTRGTREAPGACACRPPYTHGHAGTHACAPPG
jgi:hypothetical protein